MAKYSKKSHEKFVFSILMLNFAAEFEIAEWSSGSSLGS